MLISHNGELLREIASVCVDILLSGNLESSLSHLQASTDVARVGRNLTCNKTDGLLIKDGVFAWLRLETASDTTADDLGNLLSVIGFIDQTIVAYS